MALEQKPISFSSDTCAWIDALAQEEEKSFSAVVRDAVRHFRRSLEVGKTHD